MMLYRVHIAMNQHQNDRYHIAESYVKYLLHEYIYNNQFILFYIKEWVSKCCNAKQEHLQ